MPPNTKGTVNHYEKIYTPGSHAIVGFYDYLPEFTNYIHRNRRSHCCRQRNCKKHVYWYVSSLYKR